jgi:hypothetical protein
MHVNSYFIFENPPSKTSQEQTQRSPFMTKSLENYHTSTLTGIYEIDKEIIMNIVDVETLVKLYNTSRHTAAILNDQDVLKNLFEYHTLPPADNFTDFLQAYDRKYITLRCPNYHDPIECYYQAIEQENLEMINYFEKLVDPNTIDLEELLLISAGGNHDVFRKTLEKVQRLKSINIRYDDLIERAIENNKQKNFNLIYYSVQNEYRWPKYLVDIATWKVTDLDFYKEILEKFPDQAIGDPENARHWPIFEYILSIMPSRPNYSAIIFHIVTNRGCELDFLKMIEKNYGKFFTPQEIYEIIHKVYPLCPKFSELMFDKYIYKLPDEMIKQLTVDLFKQEGMPDNPNFLVKIIKVNPDVNYNRLLTYMLTFDYIETFYQILKLVPLNYNIDYQKLALISASYKDFSLLKNIFDMAPDGYNWDIEPIVEEFITGGKRTPDELSTLHLVMELLTSINPNLDYTRLLTLANRRNDTQIAGVFETYYDRRTI